MIEQQQPFPGSNSSDQSQYNDQDNYQLPTLELCKNQLLELVDKQDIFVQFIETLINLLKHLSNSLPKESSEFSKIQILFNNIINQLENFPARVNIYDGIKKLDKKEPQQFWKATMGILENLFKLGNQEENSSFIYQFYFGRCIPFASKVTPLTNEVTSELENIQKITENFFDNFNFIAQIENLKKDEKLDEETRTLRISKVLQIKDFIEEDGKIKKEIAKCISKRLQEIVTVPRTHLLSLSAIAKTAEEIIISLKKHYPSIENESNNPEQPHHILYESTVLIYKNFTEFSKKTHDYISKVNSGETGKGNQNCHLINHVPGVLIFKVLQACDNYRKKPIPSAIKELADNICAAYLSSESEYFVSKIIEDFLNDPKDADELFRSIIFNEFTIYKIHKEEYTKASKDLISSTIDATGSGDISGTDEINTRDQEKEINNDDIKQPEPITEVPNLPNSPEETTYKTEIQLFRISKKYIQCHIINQLALIVNDYLTQGREKNPLKNEIASKILRNLQKLKYNIRYNDLEPEDPLEFYHNIVALLHNYFFSSGTTLDFSSKDKFSNMAENLVGYLNRISIQNNIFQTKNLTVTPTDPAMILNPSEVFLERTMTEHNAISTNIHSLVANFLHLFNQYLNTSLGKSLIHRITKNEANQPIEENKKFTWKDEITQLHKKILDTYFTYLNVGNEDSENTYKKEIVAAIEETAKSMNDLHKKAVKNHGVASKNLQPGLEFLAGKFSIPQKNNVDAGSFPTAVIDLYLTKNNAITYIAKHLIQRTQDAINKAKIKSKSSAQTVKRISQKLNILYSEYDMKIQEADLIQIQIKINRAIKSVTHVPNGPNKNEKDYFTADISADKDLKNVIDSVLPVIADKPIVTSENHNHMLFIISGLEILIDNYVKTSANTFPLRKQIVRKIRNDLQDLRYSIENSSDYPDDLGSFYQKLINDILCKRLHNLRIIPEILNKDGFGKMTRTLVLFLEAHVKKASLPAGVKISNILAPKNFPHSKKIITTRGSSKTQEETQQEVPIDNSSNERGIEKYCAIIQFLYDYYHKTPIGKELAKNAGIQENDKSGQKNKITLLTDIVTDQYFQYLKKLNVIRKTKNTNDPLFRETVNFINERGSPGTGVLINDAPGLEKALEQVFINKIKSSIGGTRASINDSFLSKSRTRAALSYLLDDTQKENKDYGFNTLVNFEMTKQQAQSCIVSHVIHRKQSPFYKLCHSAYNAWFFKPDPRAIETAGKIIQNLAELEKSTLEKLTLEESKSATEENLLCLKEEMNKTVSLLTIVDRGYTAEAQDDDFFQAASEAHNTYKPTP